MYSLFKAKTSIGNYFEQYFKAKSIMDVFDIFFKAKSSVIPYTETFFKAKSILGNALYTALFINQPSLEAWKSAGLDDPPLVDYKVTIDGTDVTSWVRTIEYQNGWREKSTLKLSMSQVDDDGYSLKFQPDILKIPSPTYRSHGTLDVRKLKLFLTVAEKTWTSTTFLMGSPSWDGEVLSFTAEDRISLLEIKKQSMSNITPDSPRSAHFLIREICAQYGITNIQIYFEDFMVQTLTRTGRPLDWIDQILKIYQVSRYWVGDVLVFAPANITSGIKFRFVDELNIIADGGLKWDEDISNLINRVDFSRLVPQTGIIGEADCNRPECVGRTGNVTFDVPSAAISSTWQAVNGVLNAFVYFDEFDVPINTDPGAGTILLDRPAHRVEFTYQPANPTYVVNSAVGTMPYNPGYSIVFYGGVPTSSANAENYTFRQDHAPTQAAYGVIPDDGSVETSMVDGPTALKSVVAMLNDNIRHVFKEEIETRYINGDCNIGLVIGVTDAQTSQNDLDWFSEGVTISMDEDKQWSQRLVLWRGI